MVVDLVFFLSFITQEDIQVEIRVNEINDTGQL